MHQYSGKGEQEHPVTVGSLRRLLRILWLAEEAELIDSIVVQDVRQLQTYDRDMVVRKVKANTETHTIIWP